jgi:hypothetical protein
MSVSRASFRTFVPYSLVDWNKEKAKNIGGLSVT